MCLICLLTLDFFFLLLPVLSRKINVSYREDLAYMLNFFGLKYILKNCIPVNNCDFKIFCVDKLYSHTINNLKWSVRISMSSHLHQTVFILFPLFVHLFKSFAIFLIYIFLKYIRICYNYLDQRYVIHISMVHLYYIFKWNIFHIQKLLTFIYSLFSYTKYLNLYESLWFTSLILYHLKIIITLSSQ